MKMDIPFVGPAYQDESPFAAYQRCVNFYVRPYPSLRGDARYLFGTPGLELAVDLGSDGPIKGMKAQSGVLYVVCGSQLYSIDSGWTSTLIGNVGPTSDLAPMESNGVDIVVINPTNGYVYDIATSTLAPIADPDYPGGYDVAFVDGYYLVTRPNTGQVWRSDLNDGSSWGGLAFSTAGASPDNTLGIIVVGSDVGILGERTVEVWYNTGASTFNFDRIPGAVFDMGVVGPSAKTSINNAGYWVGKDSNGQGQVFQAVGRVPKVVSTPAISRAIEGYGDISDTQMWSYQQHGHSFVVCTFPSANATWVYDSYMGLWHERSSIRGTPATSGRWRASCHEYFNGYNVVGDCDTGKVYKMRSDVYDENGEDLVAIRSCPTVRDKRNRITVDSMETIFEPGVGVITGNAEDIDPQAQISWSRNGGRTWSPEFAVPMGKIGEYDNRSRVTQLGQGTDWVFQVRISAAVRRAILGAVAEGEEDE